jgi:hypothetical protein
MVISILTQGIFGETEEIEEFRFSEISEEESIE